MHEISDFPCATRDTVTLSHIKGERVLLKWLRRYRWFVVYKTPHKTITIYAENKTEKTWRKLNLKRPAAEVCEFKFMLTESTQRQRECEQFVWVAASMQMKNTRFNSKQNIQTETTAEHRTFDKKAWQREAYLLLEIEKPDSEYIETLNTHTRDTTTLKFQTTKNRQKDFKCAFACWWDSSSQTPPYYKQLRERDGVCTANVFRGISILKSLLHCVKRKSEVFGLKLFANERKANWFDVWCVPNTKTWVVWDKNSF